MVFTYLASYGLFGAVISSSLNVYILRIFENQDFAVGRSHCSVCDHVLAFYDIVPALSRLLLKGRRRHCRTPISAQCPAVELLIASILVLRPLSKGSGTGSATTYMFSGILITTAFINIWRVYIPDGIHVLILLLPCISLAAGSTPSLMNRLGGSLLIDGPLALVNLLSRGGIGWDDVKLFTVSGLLVGAAPAMTVLLTGYVTAGLWYAAPLLRGRAGQKTQIPMAPLFVVPLTICGPWFRQLPLRCLGFFR